MVSPDYVKHFVVQPPVRRDNLTAEEVDRSRVVPRHPSPRFLDDEHAGGHVPGVQFLLPEAVESPGRDVTQVERG